MPLLKEPGLLGLDKTLNPLKKDSGRAEDCNNVYLREDVLLNRPYFTNYTFESSIGGDLKGLQQGTFRSYVDTTRAYKNYVLGYVDGTVSVPGKILKINSAPASGTVLQVGDYNSSEDTSTANYYPTHTRIHADAYTTPGMPFLKSTPIKGVLSGDVMYWLGNYGLWKYDGLMSLRAGLPGSNHTKVAVSGASATRYIRSVLAYYDFSGQWIFGDYHETSEGATVLSSKIKYDPSVALTPDRLKEDAWDNGYMIIKRYDGSSLAGTFQYELVETNLVAGDWITCYTHTYGGRYVIKMKVHSVTATKILFYEDECYEKSLTDDLPFIKQTSQALVLGADLADTTSQYLHSSIQQAIYTSNAPSIGFQFVKLQNLHGLTAATIGANVVNYAAIDFTYPSTITPPDDHPFTHTFEDFYDESVVKGLLPSTNEIKYLALHRNILLAADSQYVYYCNTVGVVGSTIEDFDGLNFFTVGTPEEGPITGVYANDDYVIIHRERQSHYVTGNIITGAFQSRPYKVNKVGALSHWAQVNHAGQDFMITAKGATILGEGSFNEVGTLVENIIRNRETTDFGSFPRTSTELPLCFCTIDSSKNHIYIFYQTTGASTAYVLVLNYQNGEWFRWTLPKIFSKSSTNIIGGAAVFEDRLWTSDGSTLNIENSSGGTADSAFGTAHWTSVYRTEGEPSLEKKYTYLKVFSIGSTDWDLTAKVRFDWDTGSFTTQATKDIPDSNGQGFELFGLTARRAYSTQVRLESTGYLKVQSIEFQGMVLQKEIRK